MYTPYRILIILGLILSFLTGSNGQNLNLYYLKTTSGEEYQRMQVIAINEKEFIKVKSHDTGTILVFPRTEVAKIIHQASSVGEDYHGFITRESWDKDLIMESKRGYIGILMGFAIPSGVFGEPGGGNARTGIQFKVFNWGYRFKDYLGVGVSYITGFHQLQIGGFEPWRYRGVFAGPLLHLPISYRSNFEIRPMIGLPQTTLANVSDKIGTYNVGYSFNALFRVNLTSRVSTHFGWSFYYSDVVFNQVNLDMPIRVHSIDIGIALNVL